MQLIKHDDNALYLRVPNPFFQESLNEHIVFRELAGLDHWWTRHPQSLEASNDKCGQGEETRLVHDEILSFLSGPIRIFPIAIEDARLNDR